MYCALAMGLILQLFQLLWTILSKDAFHVMSIKEAYYAHNRFLLNHLSTFQDEH